MSCITVVAICGSLAFVGLSLYSQSSVSGEGNAARGKALFEARCTGCHALTQSHQGPKLQGVYGRTSGMVPGFAYSEALKKAAIVWDETSLQKWLTDPEALVPGNDMDFSVGNTQDRRDLSSFLRHSSGK